MDKQNLFDHLNGMFEKDQETGCWVWIGKTCSQGRYGRVIGYKNNTMAHRLSYQVHKGEIPKEYFVCHTCDNGLCINPEHLFLGTPKDNMQDCLRKGRYKSLFKNQKGQNNANARPGLEKRNRQIAEDRRSGMTYSAIKEKHGIKSNGHLRGILVEFGL